MELFLSVSRTGSFSETARYFGVSSTSVSRMITDFEAHLNVKLLLRSTRQVVLTEAGQEYARSLEQIMWSINEANSTVAAMSSAPTGLLRIHSRMMFGLGVLAPMLKDFRAIYPDISVELLLGEAKVDLKRQGIDIDFRIVPPAEAGLTRRRLFASQRWLVASPDYLADAPALQRPAQIREHACLAYLLPGQGHVWRFLAQPSGDLEEIEIRPRHTSNSGMALLGMALAGEGIALLDDYTVAEHVTRGQLVRLLPQARVTNTTFEEGIYATFIDMPLLPAKIRAFLDFTAQEVARRQKIWLKMGAGNDQA